MTSDSDAARLGQSSESIIWRRAPLKVSESIRNMFSRHVTNLVRGGLQVGLLWSRDSSLSHGLGRVRGASGERFLPRPTQQVEFVGDAGGWAMYLREDAGGPYRLGLFSSRSKALSGLEDRGILAGGWDVEAGGILT